MSRTTWLFLCTRYARQHVSAHSLLLFLTVLAGIVGWSFYDHDDKRDAVAEEKHAQEWDEYDSGETNRFFSPARNPIRQPGNLTDDLLIWFGDSEEADLMDLVSYDGKELMRRWARRYESLEEPTVTVFWFHKEQRSRTGRLALNGTDIDGIIRVERLDDGWHVADAREMMPGK